MKRNVLLQFSYKNYHISEDFYKNRLWKECNLHLYKKNILEVRKWLAPRHLLVNKQSNVITFYYLKTNNQAYNCLIIEVNKIKNQKVLLEDKITDLTILWTNIKIEEDFQHKKEQLEDLVKIKINLMNLEWFQIMLISSKNLKKLQQQIVKYFQFL